MAVAWFRNHILDEQAPIIDRDTVDERTFGRSIAKRHPAYVYSINKNSCLLHKIIEVEIHWHAMIGMNKLGRLKQPAMIARTVCGAHRALTPDRSRTCHIPWPHAELCGRCHGDGAIFPRGKGARSKKSGRTKAEAHVSLGCIVNGYPSSLEPK